MIKSPVVIAFAVAGTWVAAAHAGAQAAPRDPRARPAMPPAYTRQYSNPSARQPGYPAAPRVILPPVGSANRAAGRRDNDRSDGFGAADALSNLDVLSDVAKGRNGGTASAGTPASRAAAGGGARSAGATAVAAEQTLDAGVAAAAAGRVRYTVPSAGLARTGTAAGSAAASSAAAATAGRAAGAGGRAAAGAAAAAGGAAAVGAGAVACARKKK